MGLLTGRYWAGGDELDPGEQDTLAPSIVNRAPGEDMADPGKASPRFVCEPRPAPSGMRPAHELSSASGSAHDPEGMPAHDSTSSLIGKTDDRYYREVARLGARSPTPWLMHTREASCTETSSPPI